MEVTIKSNGISIPMLEDNAQYKNRFEIKSESSNRLYIIAQNKKTSVWSCSCPGWIIHRRCKHLKSVGEAILVLEKTVAEKKKLS